MHGVRETFSLRSLKVRIALAGAMLILASVTLTLVFVLREVGRSSEQIVLDSQEDDARRIAATVSQRLVGLQRSPKASEIVAQPVEEMVRHAGTGTTARHVLLREGEGVAECDG